MHVAPPLNTAKVMVQFFRYGPIFRTNLVGEDLIVSLDPELNNFVFQQEEKLFQIWYPESFMRIIGYDSMIATLGSLHKHVRTLVLRLFGPENLRLVLLQDVQRTAQASLLSWLDQPSIELKEAVSSVCMSRSMIDVKLDKLKMHLTISTLRYIIIMCSYMAI